VASVMAGVGPEGEVGACPLPSRLSEVKRTKSARAEHFRV
jgi:hypothetical protein